MNQLLTLLKTPVRVAAGLFAAALLAAAQGGIARPGTVNYTEGQVSLNGRELGSAQIGKAEVAPGQVLETANGRAEMLLLPGAYLRLGQDSAVRMVSPSLTDTRVELVKGHVLVEVDTLVKENHLEIVDGGTHSTIEKKGIYAFRAEQPAIQVYDGKAAVTVADRTVDVGKGKELLLTADSRLKPRKFDRERTDQLYAWSKVRSGYLAEANLSSAQVVVADNPAWWAGTGWYWNPWYDTWAFVPGAGYLYSPFGYGFYSPAYWYYNPPLYYYGGRPWRGGGFRRGVIAGRAAPAGGSGLRFSAPAGRGIAAPAPSMHAPAMGGGMHFGGLAGRR